MQRSITKTKAIACAHIINEWITQFDHGEVVDGTESFQYHILDQILKVGLGEDQWHAVSKVIVHPDHREKTVLVSVDAHDLLRQFTHNGWNWSRVDACASEIPDGDVGKSWIDRYLEVIDQSNDQ